MLELLEPKFRDLLIHPCFTMEDLQEKWNIPEMIPLDKKRTCLLITVVSVEKGVLAWSSSIRILNNMSRNIKSTGIWLNFEKIRAKLELERELNWVGEGPIGKFWTSTNALHYWKALSTKELEIFESIHPGLLNRRRNQDGALEFGPEQSGASEITGTDKQGFWPNLIGRIRGN